MRIERRATTKDDDDELVNVAALAVCTEARLSFSR